MHTYEIGAVLERSGKGDVVNLRSNASLYQTIERLLRDDLILMAGSEPGQGPKRKVYALTEAGRSAFGRAVTEMIAEPAVAFPDFPAALAFADTMPRAALLRALDTRRRLLSDVTPVAGDRPGAQSLPNRYARAMRSAELAFVEAQIERLSRES